MRKALLLLVTCFVFITSAFGDNAFARDIDKIGKVGAVIPDPACYESGGYSIYHIILLIYNIIQWLLGISGTVALLMFVVGGFYWLVAAGEKDRVKKGQDALINAVIGLIIVFGSWIFVNFVVGLFVGQTTTTATLFQGSKPALWNKIEQQPCKYPPIIKK